MTETPRSLGQPPPPPCGQGGGFSVPVTRVVGVASASADSARILAAGVALTPLRARCEAGSAELLDHFAVVGERRVQAAVDRLVEEAADILLAISQEARELDMALKNAAAAARRVEGTATDTRDQPPVGHRRGGGSG